MKIFTKPRDKVGLVPQLDLKMKLTILLFVTTLFQLRAGTGYAQKTKITLNIQGASVVEIIEEIEAVTEFSFLYRVNDLDMNRKVSIKARKKSIENILQTLFKDSPISYSINDKLIILTKKGQYPMKNSTPKPPKIPEKSNQQEFEVQGTVTAPDGSPLPGVNIIVKDTNEGTMSDPDGKYAIRVNTNDILTFSYVGFKEVEIDMDGRENIDIQMEEDVVSLEGVEVNAGYYTVKDRERTGSISRITAHDIETQPITNVLGAAIGRMPGVNIVQNTGVPGGGFTVQIRGQNSLRPEANQPLYIVDGVPFPARNLFQAGSTNILASASPLNGINPSDVESIEVLKDADATAIYGSRGANGVILITTKRGLGREGKTTIDIDIQSGVGKVANKIDLLNTEQYLRMRKEAFANDGATPTEANAPDLLLWDQDRDTDWQKELIGGTAYTTNIQASLSGGNAQTSFRLGGGIYTETTVFPGDFRYRRVSGQFNLNHWSKNRKFRIAFSINYISDNNNLFNIDITSFALTLPPNTSSFLDEDNKLQWPVGWTRSPYAQMKQKYRVITDNFISNTQLSYQIIPGLHFKTSLGYTRMQRDEVNTIPQSTIPPTSTQQEHSYFGNGGIKTWIIEPQIDYKKSFKNSTLNLLVGATFQENKRQFKTFQAIGFPDKALLENIDAASDITVQNADYTQYRYSALFGRFNYTWKEKYIVNLTGRRDGSSRFGPGKQFANFGAVGVAWMFSKEDFIKNGLPFLSFGKLRGSYGVTGSDQIGDYKYLDSWTSTNNPYQNISGLRPTELFNPDYGWERNKKLEGALELGFLNDRIFTQIGYYRNRSDNQLVGMPLPASVGFNSVQANLPATVQNTGWEIELATTNIKNKNFTWRSAVNLTVPRNKLIVFSDIEKSSYASIYEVGKSLFIQKKKHFLGVDPQTGVYQFNDVDGDGNISIPNDLQAIKEVTQDFYGGFQNSFSYKSWQLDTFFQFARQTGFNYVQFYIAPGFLSNQPDVVMNRWQQPGDITDIQQFTQSVSSPAFFPSFTNNIQSDNVIGDSSFIRLKNVSLSYQLPAELIKKMGLNKCRLYIQGQNLFTITNYLGMDPENQTVSNLPPLRMITGGVQLSF